MLAPSTVQMNNQPRHHATTLLWYDRPARELITEALPLGNGQLGALITGEPACDRWFGK